MRLNYDPSLSKAFYYRGFIQMKEGKYEVAIQDFLDASKRDPDNERIFYNLGILLQ